MARQNYHQAPLNSSEGVNELRAAMRSALRAGYARYEFYNNDGYFLDDVASGATIAEDKTEWTEVTLTGLPRFTGVMGVAQPLCIVYKEAATPAVFGQKLQFRVHGVDAFGVETVELTPVIRIRDTSDGASATAQTYLWLQIPFVKVHRIFFKLWGFAAGDTMNIGFRFWPGTAAPGGTAFINGQDYGNTTGDELPLHAKYQSGFGLPVRLEPYTVRPAAGSSVATVNIDRAGISQLWGLVHNRTDPTAFPGVLCPFRPTFTTEGVWETGASGGYLINQGDDTAEWSNRVDNKVTIVANNGIGLGIPTLGTVSFTNAVVTASWDDEFTVECFWGTAIGGGEQRPRRDHRARASSRSPNQ